jgi:CHORD
MKLFLYYEDNEDRSLHKTLKITLPRSWRSGPTSRILTQFVESYNASSLGLTLDESNLHLEVRNPQETESKFGVILKKDKTSVTTIPSDAIVSDVLSDHSNVYVQHGPSITLQDIRKAEEEAKRQEQEYKANTVPCTHFGCKKRFPNGGPYPECTYHASPPVFHETVKFWSCCPNRKAYDWNDFEAIPGCQTGICTEVKEQGTRQFLGGMELRAQNSSGDPLRSIDDFNKAQAAGGTTAAPILERLQNVLQEMGIEQELFQQVVDGMRKELDVTTISEPELLEAIVANLGIKLKATLKAIAVEQLRIK